MRCNEHKCVNNQEGYCLSSSYVTIEEGGTCSELYIKDTEEEDELE